MNHMAYNIPDVIAEMRHKLKQDRPQAENNIIRGLFEHGESIQQDIEGVNATGFETPAQFFPLAGETPENKQERRAARSRHYWRTRSPAFIRGKREARAKLAKCEAEILNLSNPDHWRP
jgi:hypothetical protein